jgi:hypothetical protein
MPVSPSLALGLGSGSDTGSTSAAGPTSAPPLFPALPAPPAPPTVSAASPPLVLQCQGLL